MINLGLILCIAILFLVWPLLFSLSSRNTRKGSFIICASSMLIAILCFMELIILFHIMPRQEISLWTIVIFSADIIGFSFFAWLVFSNFTNLRKRTKKESEK